VRPSPVSPHLNNPAAPPLPPTRYQAVAAAHPGNVECLRYAARLAAELGRPADAARHAEALECAERAAAAAAAAAGGEGAVGGDEGAPDAPGAAAATAAAVAQPRGRTPAGDGADVWGGEALGDDMLPM
jgi:hypothetical protein